jgi:hypothetical protein
MIRVFIADGGSNFASMVGFAGAPSNQETVAKWERLAEKKRDLLAGVDVANLPKRVSSRRQGWVWPASQEVLEPAPEPLRVSAIYALVAGSMDGPVSKSTVKGELRRQLKREGSGLRQNEVGRYFLDSSSGS